MGRRQLPCSGGDRTYQLGPRFCSLLSFEEEEEGLCGSEDVASAAAGVWASLLSGQNRLEAEPGAGCMEVFGGLPGVCFLGVGDRQVSGAVVPEGTLRRPRVFVVSSSVNQHEECEASQPRLRLRQTGANSSRENKLFL